MVRVTQTITAQEVAEGVGAVVRRLMPIPALRHLDPFVVLDEFNVSPPAGFPTHPHRGFEAITYMLEGGFEHKDNLGNETTVYAGGAQRFTAGAGIVHSEMPGTPDTNRGLQLWINLPRVKKQLPPDYQQIDAHDIPVEELPGVKVRKIVGDGGPVALHTDVLYQHIILDAEAKYLIEVPEAYQGLLYVLKGTVNAADHQLERGQAILFDQGGPLPLATSVDTEVALISGCPHKEPIRQWGPYVD